LHKQILPFFGIVPTLKRMMMTPAEGLASDLMAAGFPRRPLTREQFDRNKLIKDIVSDYRAGGDKRQGALTALREGKAKGMLDARAERTMITRLGLTPMQYQIQHLGPEDAMRVWRVADPQERAQIKAQVVGRVQNSKTLERSKREAFAKELMGH
jgi:hypothetical protein